MQNLYHLKHDASLKVKYCLKFLLYSRFRCYKNIVKVSKCSEPSPLSIILDLLTTCLIKHLLSVAISLCRLILNYFDYMNNICHCAIGSQRQSLSLVLHDVWAYIDCITCPPLKTFVFFFNQYSVGMLQFYTNGVCPTQRQQQSHSSLIM